MEEQSVKQCLRFLAENPLSHEILPVSSEPTIGAKPISRETAMLSPGRLDIWFLWLKRTRSILNGGNGASIYCRSCPGSGHWWSTNEPKISST